MIMKFLRQIIVILSLIAIIPTASYAEASGPPKGTTAIDLSLMFPPYANIRIWKEKHGLEFYPPDQFRVLAVTGYYLRYMYKFHGDYYLGIGYISAISRSGGQTSGGVLCGTIGGEALLYYDWLVTNFGLVYVPAIPSSYSQIYPTVQIGMRFKI